MCREFADVDQGNMDKLAFSIPMVWRGSKDRCSDCYSCLVNTQLYIKKDKRKMEYPSLPRTTRQLLSLHVGQQT